MSRGVVDWISLTNKRVAVSCGVAGTVTVEVDAPPRPAERATVNDVESSQIQPLHQDQATLPMSAAAPDERVSGPSTPTS